LRELAYNPSLSFATQDYSDPTQECVILLSKGLISARKSSAANVSTSAA